MKRLRPRLLLLLILAIFVAPLALAWMLFTGTISVRTQNTGNLGQLVQPTVPIDWSGIAGTNSGSEKLSLDGFWVIVYPLPSMCGRECLDLAAGLRQVHLASGQNIGRIKIALLLNRASPESLQRELLNIYPGFNLAARPTEDFSAAIREANSNTGFQADVYLVDPDGNIMMTYNGDSSPNKLIKDLARLLTWSKQDKRS